MERFESIALCNRWGPNEIGESFGMHLDGAARKWFHYSGTPTEWEDAPVVTAAPEVAAYPTVEGQRTRSLGEF